VCLNILNEEKAWKPSITVKMILQGVQDLLDNANLGDPAQREPFHLARDHPEQYRLRVIQEARKHAT
jgi:ubiquitin-conjugating enzyme E2 I